ncbi:MAG: phenylalanine--tRNA ligase subunit beta [Clostridia bacterium]|nr:phenylalanine--tRNA ligase subunit beta [Clostridia bacterium]
MKLPLKWLKEYVDYNVTNDEFVEKLMWRGFEMGSVDPELPGVEGVVVGKVLEIEKHQNSDHLNITKTDIGTEVLTIVTGAQNVHAGDYVPVAVVGAKLNGVEMKPVNMRGVDSYGMLCSGEELGLTEADYPGSSVHGILILREPHPLGQPIAEAVGLNDVVFDIELTPNRPDCASVIGMCREAAAALGQTFKEPEIKAVAGEGNEADYASVTVENTELCPRYTARVVTDIKIEPSPAWMQKKLRAVGLRPINNIVDITNYVMVEYGHPMHAFDLACVKDGHIIVRNARENEIVTTLDDKERAVDPEMLLIADPEKGVGIAGVMGGLNSEITENTKAVLFEAAVFKASNIRRTARTLRHTTDAAARFIKGVEAVNAKLALDRAIELVEELGAGKVIGKTIDVCAADLNERVVDIDTAHVNKLLALDLTPAEMRDMLATIGISSVACEDRLTVTVPHFRTDIESGIEADWDIAEEIARIYGYYNIKPTLMVGDTFRGGLAPEFRFEDLVKDTMACQGAYEMYNYNFTGPKALADLGIKEGDTLNQAVRILNPFGEDQSLMRTTLYMGMLDSAARNLNRKTGQYRFFEVGNVHFDNNDTLPEEQKKLGVVFFGDNEDFFTLKGSLEQLFNACSITGVSYRVCERSYFQPGRAATLVAADGTELGEIGQLHPDCAKAWSIDSRVYMAELSMNRMLALSGGTKKFSPLPKYPVVARDLAVVVDERRENADLVGIILNAPVPAGVIIGDVTLFDTYAGTGIAPGKKSLAYTFTLRAEDHTLTEEEIRTAFDAVISALAENDAPIRA